MLRIELEGLSPLLMHNPAGMLAPAGQPVTRGRRQPTAEEDAEKAVYRLRSGVLGFPAAGVRKSILEGCRRGAFTMRNPLSGRRVSAAAFLAGAIMLSADEFFPVLDGAGGAQTEYTVDARTVIVQKSRIVRGRAKVELPWAILCEYEFHREMSPDLDALRQVVDLAGTLIGIGDYRPDKGGWFGRYRVKDIQITEE